MRQNPGRIAALHQLTGGNPRTTVLLFHLYAEDFAPTVFGDLEQLLDRVTPLYKARFEELSPQMQVVAGAMANHWDPIAARQLAEATGLVPNQVSPQLDRLQKLGWVEEVELFGTARAGYQIAERFFNVWFLMRRAHRGGNAARSSFSRGSWRHFTNRLTGGGWPAPFWTKCSAAARCQLGDCTRKTPACAGGGGGRVSFGDG